MNVPMRYRLALSEKSREQLRALPKEQRRQIGLRLETLCDGLRGDIQKLSATKNRYRLRVGSFRVLFVLDGGQVDVYAVRDRKEAYE